MPHCAGPGAGTGAENNIQDTGVQRALRESDFVGGKGQLDRVSFSGLATRRNRAVTVYEQRPEPTKALSGFAVQVIASRDLDGPMEVSGQLRALGYSNLYPSHGNGWYRIRVGPFIEREDAVKVRDKLISQGFSDAWLVQEL